MENNEIHDLALAIAMQAIDEPVLSHTTTWDQRVESILYNYLDARKIIKKQYESVNRRVHTNVDGVVEDV